MRELSSSTVHTDLEAGKRLSSVASSLLIDGNVALSDTIDTLVEDSVLYTGNGTSQAVVTGINGTDFTQPYNGAGAVYGARLETNGNFDTDLTGWTDASTGCLDIS